MHMQGTPSTMQRAPSYGDVVAEVGSFLVERARELEAAGVAAHRIALDPGFGFGKTLEHNKALFRALPALAALGYPLLVGVSRKKMIGDLTGRPVDERGPGSVAAALLAAQNGAGLLRVHDVKETVDALNVWMELGQGGA
ncbi:MAG: dihydropteroate synthase, partial [Usitatibacter sp.]